MTAEDQKEEFRTAIFFKSISKNRYGVISFYCYGNQNRIENIYENGFRHYGYYQPIGITKDEMNRTVVYGVMFLFDRSLFKTKEVISHTVTHCYLVDEKFTVNTVQMREVTNPFRRVFNTKHESADINEAMKITSLAMKPSAI